MDKPEILFLCHRIPYPPNKGDKIRSWRLFGHLTRRYKVHLACFVDDKSDFAHTKKLRAMCASAIFVPLHPKVARLKSTIGFLTGEALSLPYYSNGEMTRWVNKTRSRDLVAEVAFSSTMAQYIAEPIEDRSRVVDFCDADSEKWRHYARQSAGPMRWIYAREGRKLTDAEIVIANWADASFAITPEEAGIFNAREGITRHIHYWSNGVDTEYFNPTLSLETDVKGADIVFTGAMDYRANIDAVLNFVGEVWPKIRQGIPNTTFAIVGARPNKSIKALDKKAGIIVTGRVDDVRPWLQRAQLVVAPMRVARGIQNKVLEGMAMGKPVIASTEAAIGITAKSGEEICICEGPSDMAETIISLITDPTERQRIGENARAAMLRHYNWDAHLDRFSQIFEATLSD